MERRLEQKTHTFFACKAHQSGRWGLIHIHSLKPTPVTHAWAYVPPPPAHTIWHRHMHNTTHIIRFQGWGGCGKRASTNTAQAHIHYLKTIPTMHCAFGGMSSGEKSFHNISSLGRIPSQWTFFIQALRHLSPFSTHPPLPYFWGLQRPPEANPIPSLPDGNESPRATDTTHPRTTNTTQHATHTH